ITQAEPIRRVRVAREQQRPGGRGRRHRGAASRTGRRSAAAAATAIVPPIFPFPDSMLAWAAARSRGAAPERQLSGQLGAPPAAGLGEEPVVAVEELGERDVVAQLDPGPGSHRGAEARSCGLEAVDRDEECTCPAGCVIVIDVCPPRKTLSWTSIACS